MDLSFIRTERDSIVTALPTEFAVLLVAFGACQSASPTARLQVRLDAGRPGGGVLAPADGAFNLFARRFVNGGRDL